MKKEVSMTDVFCEIEKYGKRKYREGQTVAYNTMVCETADLLVEIERMDNVRDIVATVAEFLDTVEQIAALAACGKE